MWNIELLQDVKALGGLPLFVILIIVTFLFEEYGLFIALTMSLILTFALTALLRALFFKQRPVKQPYKTLWQKIDASSFPSLHSMRAGALAAISLSFDNTGLSILVSICAVAVAISRVMLKRHFVVDVVVGLIAGAVIGFAMLLYWSNIHVVRLIN